MHTTATTTDSKKTFWGFGIYALYGGFVLFILGIVAFASLQQVNLVDPGYYQKELVYQGRIDRMKRTAALSEPVRVQYVGASRQIRVAFPNVAGVSVDQPITGDITLYRPSNAGYDRSVKIAADEDREQYIDAANLIPGLWRVKIEWAAAGADYYTENMLVIN